MIFAWFRRLFGRQNLAEILAGYEQMQQTLTSFNARTLQRKNRLEEKVVLLSAQAEQHRKDIERATLVYDNFATLLNKQIAVVDQPNV